MQNLYSVNPDWFSRILCGMSDEELKESFDTLQKFYDICDTSDVTMYYDLLDLLERYFIKEIINRFYRMIA